MKIFQFFFSNKFLRDQSQPTRSTSKSDDIVVSAIEIVFVATRKATDFFFCLNFPFFFCQSDRVSRLRVIRRERRHRFNGRIHRRPLRVFSSSLGSEIPILRVLVQEFGAFFIKKMEAMRERQKERERERGGAGGLARFHAIADPYRNLGIRLKKRRSEEGRKKKKKEKEPKKKIR